MSRGAYESYEQNYADLAALQSLVTQQGRQIKDLQDRLATGDEQTRRPREGFNELQGEIEIVSDASEGIHVGLIQVGGYTPSRNLTSEDRCQMCDIECANLVARRVMGSKRFLNPVRQQNRGQTYGEDIDMVDGPDDDAGEQSEGAASNDPGNLTQALAQRAQ